MNAMQFNNPHVEREFVEEMLDRRRHAAFIAARETTPAVDAVLRAMDTGGSLDGVLLMKTPLAGGLVRVDMHLNGLQGTALIESARWIDKDKPDTTEHRALCARVVLSAIEHLRARASQENAHGAR